MKKLILTEEEIKTLENHIGNLPNFARTINETMQMSGAIQNLMQFLGTKIVEEDATNTEL